LNLKVILSIKKSYELKALLIIKEGFLITVIVLKEKQDLKSNIFHCLYKFSINS